jgi:hypothetical protein
MIFFQCVRGDVIALQIMKMNVPTGRNGLFRGTYGHATFVNLLACSNRASCDFVADRNVVRKRDFLSVNDVPIARHNRRNRNQDIIVTMNAQQLA